MTMIAPINTAQLTQRFTRRHFSVDALSCKLILTTPTQHLLNRRDMKDERSAGNLSFFGGNVDPGETPIRALWRELDEEVSGFTGHQLFPILSLTRFYEDTGRVGQTLYFRLDGVLHHDACAEGSIETFNCPSEAEADETLGMGARVAINIGYQKGILRRRRPLQLAA